MLEITPDFTDNCHSMGKIVLLILSIPHGHQMPFLLLTYVLTMYITYSNTWSRTRMRTPKDKDYLSLSSFHFLHASDCL